MNRPLLEERIRESLEQSEDTIVHQLAREIVRLRGTALVLPELSNSEKCKEVRIWLMQPEQRDYNKDNPVTQLAFMAGMDEGYSLAVSRYQAEAGEAPRV